MNRPRPRARLSRSLGIALDPKGALALERRPYPPGVHGRSRRPAPSDYAVRLREKQRLRHQYGIREKQLVSAWERARRRPGRSGAALIAELETRLDAVVLRAGLARTIQQARQLVVHRHLLVDGHRVDRPSYRLRPYQTVTVAGRSRTLAPFLAAAAGAHAAERTPPYLAVRLADLTVTLLAEPARADVPVHCDEQLVVEFYSR